MNKALSDIRKKLSQGAYRNEEHVRLCLVSRILHKLGWDIWNPIEVNAEFPAIPNEDRTKVDLALFVNSYTPSVFIEIKAVDKIGNNLASIEKQLRDYNRNNTALFSIITDGKMWRFYLSQTGGEFAQKCFKVINIQDDDTDDLELMFTYFLSKEEIASGSAEQEANNYLQLNQRQRAIEDCLPQARRMVQSPPYPSLPQAFKSLVREKGFDITEKEAMEAISNAPERRGIGPQPPPTGPGIPKPPVEPVGGGGPPSNEIVRLNPEDPASLRFTKVEGTICGEYGKKWRQLVEIGIKISFQRGIDFHTLNSYLAANLKQGEYSGEGFSPIQGIGISMQGMDANNAAKNLVVLAKKLQCELNLRIRWHGKSPNAGKEGIIYWQP